MARQVEKLAPRLSRWVEPLARRMARWSIIDALARGVRVLTCGRFGEWVRLVRGLIAAWATLVRGCGGAWAVARFSGLKGLLPDIIVNEVFEANSSYNSMKL